MEHSGRRLEHIGDKKMYNFYMLTMVELWSNIGRTVSDIELYTASGRPLVVSNFVRTLPYIWRTLRTMVELWANSGRTAVELWSDKGRTMVEQWSDTGRAVGCA